MPTLKPLEMIEKEFQPKFKGRLEIDLMEEAVGYEQHIYQLDKGKTDASDCWYFPSLNKDFQQKIMDVYDGQDFEKAVFDATFALFPADQESVENAKDRGDQVRAEIDEYLGQNQFYYGSGTHEGKLGIIGHSMMFRIM